MRPKSTNIIRTKHRIAEEERHRQNGHLGGVVWLTGLSGSGKTTLAFGLERRLFECGCQTYVLDGDNVRHGLCGDLGFSAADRKENIRRVGEAAGLFADAGLIAIAAFISPYHADRQLAREIAQDRFFEVHLSASLDVCERRDPKGLYSKVRAGEIRDFTGIDAPYEVPQEPDLTLDTGRLSVEECLEILSDRVRARFVG